MSMLKSLGLDPSLLDPEDIEAVERVAAEMKLPSNPNNINPNQLINTMRKAGIDIDKIIKKMRGNVVKKASKRVKRNEKCPCGSNLKYKRCCGKN